MEFLSIRQNAEKRGISPRPMSITWRLDRPIPAKFLKKTNKLVVG